MEAKHWFGVVVMGVVLMGASFATNEYKKPGDVPNAQPFEADAAAPVITAKKVAIKRTKPGAVPVMPVAGGSKPKSSGGGKPKASGGGTAATVSGQKVQTSLESGLVGTVLWQGKVKKNPSIDMNSDGVCASMNAGKDPRMERLVVNGDKLQNVIVYIKNVPGNHTGKAKTDTITIDQVGCRYVPHVIGVQLGQPVKIKNSDATTHNVHFKSKLNGDWNLTQSSVGTIDPKENFRKAEIGTSLFKCDIHPWMQANVGIFDHPYFAVTNENGTFEIDTTGLPNGKYEVWAWHEKYKYAKLKGVELKAGEVVQTQWTFNSKKKNKGGVIK